MPTRDVDDGGTGVIVRGASRRFLTVDGYVDALVDVDLDAYRGAFTVVAGPSGSGKSTLLMLISALDRGDSAEITVDGIRIDRLSTRARRRWRRTALGVVMPRPSDNLTAVRDAVGNLIWANKLRGNHQALTVSDAQARLSAFGLEDAPSKTIAQLSGGEQMRLAFACAATGSPPLVVADEPTASLDTQSGHALIALIRELTASGTAVLAASHDPELVDAADAVVRLDYGRRVA